MATFLPRILGVAFAAIGVIALITTPLTWPVLVFAVVFILAGTVFQVWIEIEVRRHRQTFHATGLEPRW